MVAMAAVRSRDPLGSATADPPSAGAATLDNRVMLRERQLRDEDGTYAGDSAC